MAKPSLTIRGQQQNVGKRGSAPMIEVLTVLYGLFSGVKTIELAVEDPVARIEIYLDGKAIGKVSKPPWRFTIDLGDQLEPHELTLIARDSELVEVEREQHWINLEVARGSGPRGELSPIAIQSIPGTRLPSHPEMKEWFLANGQPVEVDRVDQKDEATLLIVRDPSIQPFLDRLATLFFQFNLNSEQTWDDVPLADKTTFVQAATRKLGVSFARAAGDAWEQWNNHLGIGKKVSVRIIEPRAAPVSRVASRKQVFNIRSNIPSRGESLLWHTTRIRPLDFQRRISDAVAVAGLEAAASGRRRAVLLLVEERDRTQSRFSAAAVESYLQRIGVPLFVWSFRIGDDPPFDDETQSEAEDRPPSATWQNARIITYPKKLSEDRRRGYLLQVEDATREVADHLERQRIVWLQGTFSPDRVELTEYAREIELAGKRP